MRQEAVLDALKTHGPMTIRQILDKIDIEYSALSCSKCNYCIRALRKYGLVEHIGEMEGYRGNKRYIWKATE